MATMPSQSTVSLLPLSTALRHERFCRLCLDSGQAARLQRLFDAGEPINLELLQEIDQLVNVKIISPDDQHARICARCLRVLEDFVNFRERCQAVDERVRKKRAKKWSPSPPVAAPEVPAFEVPSPPPPQHDEECLVVESVSSVGATQDTLLGIFESMRFCQDPADEPEVYRLVLQGFVYKPLSLLDWICEVASCGCRLDVDKNMSGCQPLAEHGHELEEEDGREFIEINPAVRAFLNTLPTVVMSKTHLPDSTLDESVMNIELYQQDDELPKLPSNVDEQGSLNVSFFNCVERGMSMVHRGYYYFLSQVRFESGTCMWQCPWSNCKVGLETNAMLTTFKPLSEHTHAPPNPSALDEATGTPISQDRAFAELAACPTNEGQTAQPEVTFYRPAKSIIGVRHDGFHFRMDGFVAGCGSRWSCTWRGCLVQLELTGTLNCRLLPVVEHCHPRPEGPVCSAVNIISPVKALIELNGKRGVMEKQQQKQHQQQEAQIERDILDGKRQPQILLSKVQQPCLA